LGKVAKSGKSCSISTFFLLNFIKGASAQPVCFDSNVYFRNIKRGYEFFLLFCKNERK